MPTFRLAFTFGCLTSIAALGCGGSDDEGGASGGTGGQLATGGAAGAAGSATGGSSSGGTPGTSVCPGVKGSCNSPELNKCAEYGGTQGDETFKSFEETCGGEWSTGACSDTGKIGSCKLEPGTGPCNTIVSYDPVTVADAQAECTNAAGTWVP